MCAGLLCRSVNSTNVGLLLPSLLPLHSTLFLFSLSLEDSSFRAFILRRFKFILRIISRLTRGKCFSLPLGVFFLLGIEGFADLLLRSKYCRWQPLKHLLKPLIKWLAYCVKCLLSIGFDLPPWCGNLADLLLHSENCR